MFRDLLTSNYDILIESGFNKPIVTETLNGKDRIVRAITLHSVVLSSLAELSQFRDGIYKIEGLKNILEKHSKIIESFFFL